MAKVGVGELRDHLSGYVRRAEPATRLVGCLKGTRACPLRFRPTRPID
jgi:hypothetical protein